MQVITERAALAKALDSARGAGRTVALVPTMGALHAGHLSLVERAVRDCDVVAVTVFVNPFQFDRPEDLEAYPRDLASDLERLSAAGAGAVFAPTAAEMYPDGRRTAVLAGPVGRRLEGASRPGHLDGVATVVAKLFATAGRCAAYFGEKDYQQLVLVRQLATDLSFPVQVVGCPTVREADGLAMSSRNALLGPLDRQAAAVLHRSLCAGSRLVEMGETRAGAVSEAMASAVHEEPRVALDYAVAADAHDLSDLDDLSGRDVRLLVAASAGSVRLIDNLEAVPGRGPAPPRKATR